jgi:hypothetical protein
MLQYVGDVNRAMGGLGVLASTQKPFVKFMIKAWPLALVAGWAAFIRVRHRMKQGELNTFNVLTDMGFILTPLVGLAMLNKIAEDNEMMAQIAANTAAQGTQAPQASPVQALMTAMQSAGPANAVQDQQYDSSDSSMPPPPQMPASSGPDQGGTTPNVQGFGGFGSHLGPPTDPPSMWT